MAATRSAAARSSSASGEHDLAENILHLVLARLPDAPQGSKGISLFIVPKFVPNADGTLGARNAITCGAIEDKMGIHGNSTCQMNMDGALGWLVGEPNKGLPAMFVMMNGGAHRRRQPGPRPDRSGLPERRRLRQGPLADAQPVGPEGAGQAGRPDHRAPRRAQDAAHRARLCRRRAGAGAAHRAAARPGTGHRRRRSAQTMRR